MPTIKLVAKDINPGIITDYLMLVNAVTAAIARGGGHAPAITINLGTLYVGFSSGDYLEPGFIQVMTRSNRTIVHIATHDTKSAKTMADSLVDQLEIINPEINII